MSYSHRDAAFARRLQRQLETYRLPQHRLADTLPEMAATGRLKPIFRDRDELAAAADLPGAVREAIEASGHMIVICSAHSAGSAWVKRELALFRDIHGDRAILAAMDETITPDMAPLILNAMFPEAAGPQPLAAHFNRHGDGARLALLKIVAALAGLRLDALVQRDAQRRVHHVTRLGIGAVAGMAVMAGLAVVAINERNAAELERGRGERLIGFMLTKLRSELKGVGRLDLLDSVNAGVNDYFRSQDLSHLSDSALQQRAQFLQAAGEDDMSRGKFEQARAQFEESERTTAALLAAQPSDQGRMFAHSQSKYWVGYINWRLNNFPKAEAEFEAYAALMIRLVELAPNNAVWLEEMGNAEVNLGMFVFRRSLDVGRAQAYFTTALGVFESLAKSHPDDLNAKLDLVGCRSWLGDVYKFRHDYDHALNERNNIARILASLLKNDPGNAQLTTSQVYNNLALARINIARGATDEAIANLDEGHKSALELVRRDTENADMRQQARLFELFQARTWMSLPQAARPGDSAIVAAIGDCELDRVKLGSAELAHFCDLVELIHLAKFGDLITARHRLAQLQQELQPQQGKLTESWGLNFDDEIATAIASIDQRSK